MRLFCRPEFHEDVPCYDLDRSHICSHSNCWNFVFCWQSLSWHVTSYLFAGCRWVSLVFLSSCIDFRGIFSFFKKRRCEATVRRVIRAERMMTKMSWKKLPTTSNMGLQRPGNSPRRSLHRNPRCRYDCFFVFLHLQDLVAIESLNDRRLAGVGTD